MIFRIVISVLIVTVLLGSLFLLTYYFGLKMLQEKNSAGMVLVGTTGLILLALLGKIFDQLNDFIKTGWKRSR